MVVKQDNKNVRLGVFSRNRW